MPLPDFLPIFRKRQSPAARASQPMSRADSLRAVTQTPPASRPTPKYNLADRIKAALRGK